MMDIYAMCTACGVQQHERSNSVSIQGDCPHCKGKQCLTVEIGCSEPPAWFNPKKVRPALPTGDQRGT